MTLRPLQWPLLSIAACQPYSTGVRSLDVTVEPPAVVLQAAEDALGYGGPDRTCFSVPGVARGTGVARNPELALGQVWTTPADCLADPGDEACDWSPSTDIYVGPAIATDLTEVDAFRGFTRFDATASTAALAGIFGTTLAPGAIAEISATRTWAGTVDYRDPGVQAWLDEQRSLHGEEEVDALGFSWSVSVFTWTAHFLVEDEEGVFGDDEVDLFEIDGAMYRRSSNEQVGYEVFACLIPL